MIRTFFVAAAFTALVFAGQANAETLTVGQGTGWNKQAVTVNYSPYNLNAPRGAETVYGMLKSASRKVCEYDTIRGRTRAQRACASETLASAVEAVDAPLVTAFYQDDTRFNGRVLVANRAGSSRQ
jgi:UrcA family protein